jgi:PAT family beta-lactamase induction signal transducer AmpG
MSSVTTDKPRKNIWSWLPSLYVAEALPYVAVNTLTVYLYTQMKISMTEMAFYTGWLYLPWVIKPIWSPFVDIYKTKRTWVLSMQLLMGICFALVTMVLPTPFYFAVSLFLFWMIAFFSATHDIAADGYYMLQLSQHDQAAYVGVRSTFYRIGSLLASGGLVWVAGRIQENGLADGTQPSQSQILTSWMWIFGILAAFFILLALFNYKYLPKPSDDVKKSEKTFKSLLDDFCATIVTFFKKRYIGSALLFMLLYRLPEALCIKLVTPFLLDSRANGGLAMTASQVGIANGGSGVIALLLGGILGGIVISKGGLKRWLWPMALSLTLPCVLYCFLAMLQPQLDYAGLTMINVAIFIEQFGYGFGFTAFMMYLMYFAEGEWKTAHYAFCTAFMALGMMLPGMAAGWIYDSLQSVNIFNLEGNQGYVNFFWLVIIASIFTFVACVNVKIDPQQDKH